MQQSDRRSVRRKVLGVTSNTHELFLKVAKFYARVEI